MPKTTINDQKSITVDIPLTTTSGKIRIKNRSSFYEYGLPVATRQNNFLQSNYVEWQIGYDTTLDDAEKMAETTLGTKRFTAYNHREKALYELSEYMFYLVTWGFIKELELRNLCEVISRTDSQNLIENHSACQIKRTHPKEIKLNDVAFYESKIEYPLLVHRFEAYEIIAEIVVREKQKAVGTQAMLYFCFPITELTSSKTLLGRAAEPKETANFIFDKHNYRIIPEMIRIFGMLSESHRFDTLAILKLIHENIFS